LPSCVLRGYFGSMLPVAASAGIFRECIITCIVAMFGLRNLDAMNEDMVAWECDYPHSDTTWPRSPEVVWDSVQGLTDEQINKITHANTMHLFSFDPFAVRPREGSTVGALRAEAAGRDVVNVSHGLNEHKVMTLGEFVGAAKR
jgi:hypothetical protein